MSLIICAEWECQNVVANCFTKIRIFSSFFYICEWDLFSWIGICVLERASLHHLLYTNICYCNFLPLVACGCRIKVESIKFLVSPQQNLLAKYSIKPLTIRTVVFYAKFKVKKLDGTNNLDMWQWEVMYVLIK